MIKSIITISIIFLSLTGFASTIPQQDYIPFPLELKMERNTFPYLSCGIGSIAIGVQGGVLKQFDSHGLDLRLGAGSIIFTSGVNAHVNYLKFPEIWGKRNFYFGGGAGICYRSDFLIDKSHSHVYAGPNLVIGRKVVNAKGKIRFHDINFLFPVNPKSGNWCIPTASVGWLF
jgi:hypothetical protein